MLEFTDKIVGLLTMRNPAKRAIRDTVIPLVTRLPAVQRRVARRLSQVSVAYPPGARSSCPTVAVAGGDRGPASVYRTSRSARRTDQRGCTSCCGRAATYW